LRSKLTGAQVGAPVGLPADKQIVTRPDGSQYIIDKTATAPGTEVAPATIPDLTFRETPEGLVGIHPKTGEIAAKAIGGAPTPDQEKFARPDGSQFLRDKRSGAITEVAPATKAGDVIPAQEQELFAINKAREARGEKALTAEELIKLKQVAPTQINVGTDGSMFQKPEAGYDYERTPDGKVKIGEDGRPRLYQIAGGSPTIETAEKAAAKVKEQEKEASAKRLKLASTSAVVTSARDALKLIEEPSFLPSTGFGASVGKMFGGTTATNLAAKLSEINSNTAFAQLKAMRESSASGASGLGQVTDFEQRMLSSATANLDQYQSPDQLKKQLRKVQAVMMVLAENSFDEKTSGAYEAALAAKMKEIEGEVTTKTGVVRRKQ
jgi:hypothetical protein